MDSNFDYVFKRKECKPIKRSGYRNGKPYKSTSINKRNNVKAIISYNK